MPRYARQRTMSDCGPVAILNIMKWLGHKVTYDSHIDHIKRESKYEFFDDFQGVKRWNVSSALKRIAHVYAVWKPVVDLEHLKKHVANGGAFILWHSMSKEDAHYTTVVPGQDGNFDWINMGPRKTVLSIQPELFENRVMSTQSFHDQVMALMIRKKNVRDTKSRH